MVFVAPPPPLTRKQFEKVRANGATTMREIDPELWKWQQGLLHNQIKRFFRWIFRIKPPEEKEENKNGKN